jgi:hypothetical protein
LQQPQLVLPLQELQHVQPSPSHSSTAAIPRTKRSKQKTMRSDEAQEYITPRAAPVVIPFSSRSVRGGSDRMAPLQQQQQSHHPASSKTGRYASSSSFSFSSSSIAPSSKPVRRAPHPRVQPAKVTSAAAGLSGGHLSAKEVRRAAERTAREMIQHQTRLRQAAAGQQQAVTAATLADEDDGAAWAAPPSPPSRTIAPVTPVAGDIATADLSIPGPVSAVIVAPVPVASPALPLAETVASAFLLPMRDMIRSVFDYYVCWTSSVEGGDEEGRNSTSVSVDGEKLLSDEQLRCFFDECELLPFVLLLQQAAGNDNGGSASGAMVCPLGFDSFFTLTARLSLLAWPGATVGTVALSPPASSSAHTSVSARTTASALVHLLERHILPKCSLYNPR